MKLFGLVLVAAVNFPAAELSPFDGKYEGYANVHTAAGIHIGVLTLVGWDTYENDTTLDAWFWGLHEGCFYATVYEPPPLGGPKDVCSSGPMVMRRDEDYQEDVPLYLFDNESHDGSEYCEFVYFVEKASMMQTSKNSILGKIVKIFTTECEGYHYNRKLDSVPPVACGIIKFGRAKLGWDT